MHTVEASLLDLLSKKHRCAGVIECGLVTDLLQASNTW